MKGRWYILILGLLTFSGNVFSQQIHQDSVVVPEHRPFDQEEYQELIEGVEYQENLPPYQKPKERKNRSGWDLGWDFGFLGELFRVFGIVFVIGLLGFLIFRLVDEGYLKGKKIIPDEDVLIQNLEEYIHEVDLDALLSKALDKQNYKLAIRIYYLIIIKSLSNNGIINWKKDKTNGEFLSETYDHHLHQPFGEVTRLFERVWYGDVQADKALYEKLSPVFSGLRDQLKIKEVQPNE